MQVSRKFVRIITLLVVLITLIILNSGCGSSDSDVTSTTVAAGAEGSKTAILTYQGDDREEAILKGAREEGTMTWYTSLAGAVVARTTAAFEKKYPEISVKVFRASSNTLVSRVLQELSADRVEADVFETTPPGVSLLKNLGATAPFFSPYAADISERWKDPEGDLVHMLADRASYVGFAYNTNLLDKSQLPETWDDLASPEMEGKLALPTSGTGVRWIGNVLFVKGEEEGLQLLQDIKDNDITLEAVSGAAIADLIASGEHAAGPAVYRNHALALKESGAPIDWVPIEPSVANIGYVMMSKTARHPNAGMLFADFLLGPEGMAIKEGLFYPPPYRDISFDIWIPGETYDDPIDFADDFERWNDMLDEIFAGS